MKTVLFKGFHGADIKALISNAWETGEPLLICPPDLKVFDFVTFLGCDVTFDCVGDRSDSDRVNIAIARGSDQSDLTFTEIFPSARPVFGVFTTGTMSGTPRLVLYSQKNILSSVGAISALFDVARIKKIFCYAQPFHTFGKFQDRCRVRVS